jgi:hypothetical protein
MAYFVQFPQNKITYILWPEDGQKQMPKHVVSLVKQTENKLCCDL